MATVRKESQYSRDVNPDYRRCQSSLLGMGHRLSVKDNRVKDEPGPALGIQALLKFRDLRERGQVRWGLECRSGEMKGKKHMQETAVSSLPTPASLETTGPEGPSHTKS